MKTTHFTIKNPFSQAHLRDVPWLTKENLEKKIKLVKKETHYVSNQERSNILLSLSTLILDNEMQLANLMAQEIAKPLKDCLLEIQRASLTAKQTAYEIATLKGEVIFGDNSYLQATQPSQKMGIVKRIPYGVVLAIVPFNFPINLAIHKIAPAYAAGNSILLKPHPQCFACTQMLIELCAKAGMRENDIQLIYPDNETLQQLIAKAEIDLISFTGGFKTAQIISTFSGVTKTIFELGGNDALVVYPDADLNKVVETIINQRFKCAGQRCNAPKRIFLHKDIFEIVSHNLQQQIINLKIGDPLDLQTDIGPVISQEAAASVINRVEKSIHQGAKSLNKIIFKDNLIHPIILSNVHSTMPIVAEETFGPVAPLFIFEKTEDVIKNINSCRQGLQCGVFTNNISTLKIFFEKVNVGTIISNEGPAYRLDHFPFGGLKDSGNGREGTSVALLEYSTSKTLIL